MEINIIEARQSLGITQRALGEAIGINRVHLGQMERGQKPIKITTALAIRCLLHDAQINPDTLRFNGGK